MEKIPVVAVVGPTASGKSDLAVEICLKFNGEIISADSMQIYKGMDIATAKVTEQEMRGIPHYMVDFLDSSESFSVADFQKTAEKHILEIYRKGKLSVVAGGTGLYVDTLLDNVKLAENSFNPELREKLLDRAQNEGSDILLEELRKIDPEYAEKLHANNVKRIVRALEVWHTAGITMTAQIEASKRTSPYDVCYIGLDAQSRDFLYERINKRVDVMFEKGLEAEARQYLKNKNNSTSAQAIGYKELEPYFNGEISFEEASENLKRATRRYAKRQLTWFHRNERINWIYIDKYENKQELAEKAFEIIERECISNEKK